MIGNKPVIRVPRDPPTPIPMFALIGDAFLVSAPLAAGALAPAALAGVPAGVPAARRPGRWLDRLLTGAGVVGGDRPPPAPPKPLQREECESTSSLRSAARRSAA